MSGVGWEIAHYLFYIAMVIALLFFIYLCWKCAIRAVDPDDYEEEELTPTVPKRYVVVQRSQTPYQSPPTTITSRSPYNRVLESYSATGPNGRNTQYQTYPLPASQEHYPAAPPPYQATAPPLPNESPPPYTPTASGGPPPVTSNSQNK